MITENSKLKLNKDWEDKANILNVIEGLGFKPNANGQFIDLCSQESKEVGIFHAPKTKFYKTLESLHKDFFNGLSQTMFPDDAIINFQSKKVLVCERKFQQVAGSTDEKIQTCAFKKFQYEKLLNKLGYEVSFCFVLNDWFKQKRYSDSLAYIESSGCKYFFNSIEEGYVSSFFE